MPDAVTGRTCATGGAPPRVTRRCAPAGGVRRSTAVPCPVWSIATYVINILPIETKIKHRRAAPACYHTFKLKVTFCVRGVRSPLLANIYLHYVFDLWAEQWRGRHARGDVIIVRYCDDFIVGFQHQDEAERFWVELRERFHRFNLELHPEKTRLIEFGRFAVERRKRRGEGKPETFDFLGFTHICGKTRKGKFTVRRKTVANRLRRKLHEVKQTLRKRMCLPIPSQGTWLRAVLLGYYRYFAVPRNSSLLRVFREGILRSWCRTLRRRSQRHRITWRRMYALAQQWLPQPRILHPYPAQRLCVTT